MVDSLMQLNERVQIPRHPVVLRAANSSNDERYAEQDKQNRRQESRFVAASNDHKLNLVVWGSKELLLWSQNTRVCVDLVSRLFLIRFLVLSTWSK